MTKRNYVFNWSLS